MGCVMSGKFYSLGGALVSNRQQLPDPADKLRRGVHDFTLTRSGNPLARISVLVSDARATAVDYDPSSPYCDGRIREEVAFIARADGLIVVLDSRVGREEANIEAFARLQRDLLFSGQDPRQKPMVFQANWRDESKIVSMEWIRENFTADHCAYVESAATKQFGLVEAMREVLRLTGAIGLGSPYRGG